jgi:MYXO-CTERM domain-containing protein
MTMRRIAFSTAVPILLAIASAPAAAQDDPAAGSVTTTEHEVTFHHYHRSPPYGLLGLLGLFGLLGLRRRHDVVVERVDRVVAVETPPKEPLP